MTNSKGYRRGTRKLFAKKFRHHGTEKLSTFMHVYKRGQYVDIKANSTFHKGMPFKVYHGRTGKVFDVSRRAVGVIVNKQVKNRIIAKKIHVRVEHVQPSKCNKDFLERKQARTEALRNKEKVDIKRMPQQPRNGRFVNAKLPIVDVVPYKIQKAY